MNIIKECGLHYLFSHFFSSVVHGNHGTIRAEDPLEFHNAKPLTSRWNTSLLYLHIYFCQSILSWELLESFFTYSDTILHFFESEWEINRY